MRLIIDLILLFIMVLCIWEGYKHGLIRSILGLSAIILSLVISNVISGSLAKELVPAVEPFVGGYIDSEKMNSMVLERLGYADTDKSLTDILEEDSSLQYDYAYWCMRETGFFGDASEDLAEDTVNYAQKNGCSLTDAVITVVCNTAAYVICETIIFIMIIVLASALLDLFNLNIRLPNADIIDDVGGAAIGFIKGFLICVLICWLLGFLGLLLGKDASDKGLIGFFLAFRFITRTLI